jgi:hypothetical protein
LPAASWDLGRARGVRAHLARDRQTGSLLKGRVPAHYQQPRARGSMHGLMCKNSDREPASGSNPGRGVHRIAIALKMCPRMTY